MSVTNLWLLAGAVLIIAEALGASGFGLIFAGLGAITVGILLTMQSVTEDATVMQFVVFVVSTSVWAALLWKPLQKIIYGRGKPGYNNVVGETAYVGSAGLNKHSGGEVTWSGTIVKAKLAPDVSVDKLDAGTQVTIVEVVGATLIVRPKA